MGDTETGSWGSRELGGYIRREEARKMAGEHRQGELEVSLRMNGAEVATTRIGWPNPYEIEHGGKKWWFSGEMDGKGRPIYTDKEAKVDFR